jgi:PPOX class probable F420-dependent enzyme
MIGGGRIMATTMTRSEALAFITQGTRTGHLATVRSDGRPHVAPIWFIVDGDDIVFNTGEFSVKGKNLLAEGRASISVDDAVAPYSFVVASGPVAISRDPVDLLSFATRIGGRYMGSDRADEYGMRNGVPGELLVRLRCTTISGVLDVSG